jgi:hypothetical protein
MRTAAAFATFAASAPATHPARPPLILSVTLGGFSDAATGPARPSTESFPNRPKPARTRIRDATRFPTDALRDLIRAAFEADARVPSERIGIAVGADVVALFGTVPDERARRAAFELASAIPGAPPVWNRLRLG